MEGRKLVRLLILVFLCLTLLFYFMYFSEETSKTTLSDEFVSGAVENLTSSGVKVSADVIDKTIHMKDIYTFSHSSLDEYHDGISSAVINTVFTGTESAVTFNMPDGISVGIYDKSDSSSECGRIIMSGSDLSFAFTKSGVSLSGLDKPVAGGNDEIGNKKNLIEKFISSASVANNIKYRISGVSQGEKYTVVTAVQMIDGEDVVDAFVNFVFDNKGIVGINGSLITKKAVAEYNNTLVDGVNVLYKLNTSNVDEIKSERIVYFLRKNDSGKFFIVPGWEITYTDKNGALINEYFNAL